MSFRCTELGVNLSREALGPATHPNPLYACGQITAFCPTASAPETENAAKIDFEPLRAHLRSLMEH